MSHRAMLISTWSTLQPATPAVSSENVDVIDDEPHTG